MLHIMTILQTQTFDQKLSPVQLSQGFQAFLYKNEQML
jgi:hypothetical protein